MITRSVLLRHDVPEDYPRGSHWDLLLERDNACWTWALEELPIGISEAADSTTVTALRLNDHRKHYLDYEGPVSEDRGSVCRALTGNCEWIEIADDRLKVRLEFASTECTLLMERVSENLWQLSTE